MKKNFTLKRVLQKKENWLVLAMFGLLFVFGCYEFKLVDQPTSAYTNSSFDVNIVMTEDADDSNSWTDEGGDLTRTGLFGVLLPTGWTIDDSIVVSIVAADSLFEDDVWKKPTTDHSADYYLAYNVDQTTMLNDSTPAPPDGYYWWGAATTVPVDMSFFDSLYFTVNVMTDASTGDFFLQYVAGDVDFIGRMPFDPLVQTDPLPINVISNVGVNEILKDVALNVYPNPTYGHLTIDIAGYNGKQVDMMVYDLRGAQIMTRQITNAQTTLDLVDLKAGAYVIRLEAEGEVLTRKFVKN